MKKVSILLALVLLLTLAACTAKDPDNLFETSEPTCTTDVSTETTAKYIPVASEENYPYANKQKDGTFMDDGKLIYFEVYMNEEFGLYTYDKATGAVSPLCRDATCSHGSSQCNSKNVSSFEVYDGIIYAAKAVGTGWNIMELKNGRFEQVADGSIYEFWHAGGNLYARTADNSLVVFENGSGEPQLLMDEYLSYGNVVFGQYLYGRTMDSVTRVDLSAADPTADRVITGDIDPMIDGEHIYYVDYAGGAVSEALYRCSMDGSDPVLLIDEPVLPASLTFDEEYLYYRLYAEDFWADLEAENYAAGEDHLAPDLYRMSKEDPTQVEKIATIPEGIYQIYTIPGYDKIFVTTRRTPQESGALPIYAVAKDGSSIELLKVDTES